MNQILRTSTLTYLPTWEPIKEALQRIVVAGLSKKQAQRDLCRAIGDGKIAIRLDLAADPSRGLPRKALSFPTLEIPPLLSPEDIDWPRSRPSQRSQLWTGPSQRPGEPTLLYFHKNHDLMGRTVDLIEVRVADVTKVFGNTESQPEAKTATGSLNLRPKNGAKVAAVVQALNELWPGRIPDELSAKDRDRRITERLRTKGLSIPSPRTIQRALKLKDR
jgi:hypothetical protein